MILTSKLVISKYLILLLCKCIRQIFLVDSFEFVSYSQINYYTCIIVSYRNVSFSISMQFLREIYKNPFRCRGQQSQWVQISPGKITFSIILQLLDTRRVLVFLRNIYFSVLQTKMLFIRHNENFCTTFRNLIKSVFSLDLKF